MSNPNKLCVPSTYTPTQRAVCLELDKILGYEFKVLDHGFVTVIDYMGDDNTIAQTARVSTGSQNKGEEQNTKLINYLVRHKHTSTLEFAEITFKIKMPIFVARQWMRHRAAHYNELSGRYTEMPDEFYVPNPDRVKAQSKANKQGSDGKLSYCVVENFLGDCGANSVTFDDYQTHLRDGVARETARINLPLSTYTVIYWKIDAHNLMHFIQLRNDDHAQWEIRQYAAIIETILARWLPITYGAFKKRIRRDRFAQKFLWSDDDYEALRSAVVTDYSDETADQHETHLQTMANYLQLKETK